MHSSHILAALLALPVLAQAGVESVGTTSANFLKIPAHARAAAMGEAFSAVSDDETALLYNPSGLAGLLQNQISATHIEWFQGIRLEHAGAVFGLGELGTLGASLTWLQVDELVRTERVANSSNPLANFRELGTFSPHDMAFSLAGATMFRHNLALGATLRILNQNIDDKNGFAASADIGGQWRGAMKGLDLGVVLRNAGSAVSVGSTPFQLPLDITGGMAYRLPNLPLKITLDTGMPVDNQMMFGVGAEAWIYDILALRGGWRGGFANQMTAGAGFRLVGFQLDYAWAPFNELGNTHRLTASYNFGSPPLGLDSDKPLIGPIGDLDKRQMAFLPRASQPDRVRGWNLRLYDSGGLEVRALHGDGALPASIPWDGKDSQGRVLPDGVISARLDAGYDSGISTRSGLREVELDSLPPKVAFEVTPKIHRPDGSGAILIPARFTLSASDKHGLGGWSMEIRTKEGQLFRSFSGTGDPPAEIIWDGRDTNGQLTPSGRTYIARAFSRDTLGNRGESQPLAQVVLLKEIQFTIASDALFEPGKADVRMSAYQELKEMKAKIMQYYNPGSVVEIIGHTDATPVVASVYGTNEALSMARAEAVIKFMTTLLGMDPAMFKPVGKGDTKPVAENETPEGREKNRRVEIVIQGKTYQ